MARAQQLESHHTLVEYRIEGGALAFIDSSENPLAPLLIHQREPGGLLASIGVPLVPEGRPEAWLAQQAGKDFDDCVSSLTDLDGAHCTIVVDAGQHRLAIVTDILGMQPVYIYRRPDCLLIASELRAFHASGLVPVVPDAAGWGAFLSFGHFIADRSMLDDVRRLPAAAVLEFDARELTHTGRTYWRWPPPEREISTEEYDSGAVLEALERDVARYLDYSAQTGMLLSGGFDSRLLMALVLRQGALPDALSVLHEYEAAGADGRFAAELAKRFHLSHTMHHTPREFYRTAEYLQYVHRNQCATQSLHLFIAQVAQHVTPSLNAVWEGVFPGPCFRTPASFLKDPKRTGTSTSSGLWHGADVVFAPKFLARMRQEYGQSLHAEVEDCGSDAVGAKKFFVRNRTRYRTAPNPLSVYANSVMPFTPGVNRDLWHVNVNVAGRHDGKADLYTLMFRRHLPEFLTVPVISAGTLYGRRRLDARVAVEKARLAVSECSSRLRRRVSSTDTSSGPLHAGPLMDRVLAHVSPDDPCLSADAVRSVQRRPGGSTLAHKVLFYWQLWTWIMEDTLTPTLIAGLANPQISKAPRVGN